jgi:uroporphyrinogen-III decarboxylase
MGGMDASSLLPFGTVDEVRAATHVALRDAAPGSGYILRSTTELSNAIPLENIIVMWDVVREHGRYPLNSDIE